MISPEAPAIDIDLQAQADSAWLHSKLAQTWGESRRFLHEYMRIQEISSDRFQCPPLMVGEDESSALRCACRPELSATTEAA